MPRRCAVLSADDIPVRRPAQLRLRTLDVAWYRVDVRLPSNWTWQPYPTPRNRFDPVDGTRRLRYAARTERGALRERFHDRGRRLGGPDLAMYLVVLRGRIRVLDLRNEKVLDALGIDGEIGVGRAIRVMHAAHTVAAHAFSWFGDELDGFVYPSRTTPRTSANLAFSRTAPLRPESMGMLADQRALLRDLIADDAFRIDLPDWT